MKCCSGALREQGRQTVVETGVVGWTGRASTADDMTSAGVLSANVANLVRSDWRHMVSRRSKIAQSNLRTGRVATPDGGLLAAAHIVDQ